MGLGSSRLAARQELSETRAAALGVPELDCVPSCVRECGARMWGFKCMRESRALVIVHSVTPQPSHGHRTILLLPHTSHTNKTHCVCVCEKYYKGGQTDATAPSNTKNTRTLARALALDGRALSASEEGLRVSVDYGTRGVSRVCLSVVWAKTSL